MTPAKNAACTGSARRRRRRHPVDGSRGLAAAPRAGRDEPRPHRREPADDPRRDDEAASPRGHERERARQRVDVPRAELVVHEPVRDRQRRCSRERRAEARRRRRRRAPKPSDACAAARYDLLRPERRVGRGSPRMPAPVAARARRGSGGGWTSTPSSERASAASDAPAEPRQPSGSRSGARNDERRHREQPDRRDPAGEQQAEPGGRERAAAEQEDELAGRCAARRVAGARRISLDPSPPSAGSAPIRPRQPAQPRGRYQLRSPSTLHHRGEQDAADHGRVERGRRPRDRRRAPSCTIVPRRRRRSRTRRPSRARRSSPSTAVVRIPCATASRVEAPLRTSSRIRLTMNTW